MTTTTYLITGTNRGIGKGLVQILLLRPNTHVIGTIRNPHSPDVIELQKLTTASGSKLNLIEMELSQSENIFNAISKLQVDKIDVVISNAAILRPARSVTEVPIDEVLEHFQVNTIGSLALYQATKPLLDKSTNPKFIFVSSSAGSIGIQANYPFNGTSYSVSKAAINTIGARLAVEEQGKLIVLILTPGPVDTDMQDDIVSRLTDFGFDFEKLMSGFSHKILSIEEAATQFLKIIDDAKHEDSGKFISTPSGEIVPW